MQFGSGGHILYFSRIRKKVIENREQTEKAISEATLILWIAGLSGQIRISSEVLKEPNFANIKRFKEYFQCIYISDNIDNTMVIYLIRKSCQHEEI